jgi:Fe2+ or Zn2+ uptake regulation protein
MTARSGGSPRPPRSNGRRTKQLEATYEVVRAARDHPTAEQVHVRVQRTLAHISLGTVYRNLQKLVEQGRIRTVELDPRRTRFDGMLEHHEHFVCDACGDIHDLSSANGQLAVPRALRRAGFRVQRQALTLFGLCPKCDRAAARPLR